MSDRHLHRAQFGSRDEEWGGRGEKKKKRRGVTVAERGGLRGAEPNMSR